MTLPERC